MKQMFFAAAFCLFCAPLFAQVMGNYSTQQNSYQQVQINANYRAVPKAASFISENEVEITINALCNRQADAYVAIFAIQQVGKTADETNTLLNARLSGFTADLKTLGIPDSNVYVDMVNFLPKYEYDVTKKIFSKKNYTEVPKGFEMQKNVHIRYTNPALLDQIVTAAARQEIYDIVKVDYFIRDSREVYSRLRDVSFNYLRQIRTQYRSIGLVLDSAYTVTAENAWVAYPMNRYESYQAYSSTKLDQDEKQSSVVNPADKPVSRFYNAIPANDYDIVINPEILEPAIQFSYNLVVRFTLPERKPVVKTEVKKEFLLVSPDGNVKTLKIE